MAKTGRPSNSGAIPRRHEIDELIAATQTAIVARLTRARHEREELTSMMSEAKELLRTR